MQNPVTRAFFSLVLILSASAMAVDSDCSGKWERFSSLPYQGTLFPDLAANYWRYRFEIPNDGRTGLRVTGRFTHSRYMNFNIYDQATLDSDGSLPDRDIVPDTGSSNPFLEGVPRNVAERNYTAWVIPAKAVSPAGAKNILRMPSAPPDMKLQAIELWYRVYVADPGKNEMGGVDLPTITAFDLATGHEMACPPKKEGTVPFENLIKNLPPKGEEGKVNFYASRGASLYANRDNRYVIGRLSFREGKVVVARVKVPTFFNDTSPEAKFSARTEVRYWSLCLGGISTQTSSCLIDKDALVAKDGFVNVVVGPERLEAQAKAKKLNFIPRGWLPVPHLIFRNLLTQPGYAGNMEKVPTWPQPEGAPFHSAKELMASNFIGDYAPRGQHCSEEEFLDDLQKEGASVCGIEVSH